MSIRSVLLMVCLIPICLEISGLILSGSRERPNEAMLSLLENPEPRITNPAQNGYYLLIGFTASRAAAPVQVGLTTWLETALDPASRFFDYAKPGRADLRVSSAVLQGGIFTVHAGIADMREQSEALWRRVEQAPVLLERYEQLLTMPFEDRGYGHAAVPRYTEIFLAHRLYLAAGFAQGAAVGLDRLERDLRVWRTRLREAKTLHLKVAAATIVSDDAHLLSDLLSRRSLHRVVANRIGALAQPLTSEERSLRWPIRNEFIIGQARPDARVTTELTPEQQGSIVHAAWMASAAGLPKDAFQQVERSLSTSLFGLRLMNQRTLNMYATYYQAVINTSETGPGPLPQLRHVARTSSRTLTDTLFSPVFEEPPWELFTMKLRETDARLRLTALQAALRTSPSARGVLTRIAELGTDYYDPFTELPMIWNAQHGWLYSVGSDGLDDGGDPTFDILVTLPLEARSTI